MTDRHERRGTALICSLIAGCLATILLGCGSPGPEKGDSTTSTLPCPSTEHVVDDGINPPRCVPHDTTATTSPRAPADPDKAVVELSERLNSDQAGVTEIIESTSPLVVSGDEFTVAIDRGPMPSATFNIVVTSSATDQENRDDAAYAVAFAVADLWGGSGGFRNPTGVLRPSLHLTIDTVVYDAPMELMVQLYDFKVSKEDFLERSRQ